MSVSVGEIVVQAMVDALNAPSDKPVTTYRTRIDAFAASELPAMVLYAVDETPELKGPDTYLRTRMMRLEVLVSGTAPADGLIDPLYVYAVNTLLNDDALKASIRKLRQAKVQWETQPGLQDVCAAAVDFEVVFVTQGDPTVRLDR